MPTISQDVLAVLDAATIEGSRVFLNGQLDRKLYTETNKVLEAAGGKWNRGAKAHLFDGDAADVLEPIILTGEYRRTKQDFGQFDTPEDLAPSIVELAKIEPGMIVIEPSVGIGRLANEAARAGATVIAYEIDEKRLQGNGDYVLHCIDFLQVPPHESADRVVMNPPFAKQADIEHVRHAFLFLKPGGRLVAIMSAGIRFRTNGATRAFRDFVAAYGGSIKSLPDGAFRSSGTDVSTCVVIIDKPEGDE